MDLEKIVIALKSEITELNCMMNEKTERFNEAIATKDAKILELQDKFKETEKKFNEELDIKSQELMTQYEEAMNELIKQREQLAAKLQFERRNTMIGWQRAMSVRDPGAMISEEVFKLRETLSEKEKEIARVMKNNKELKLCWKDSAKLLKAVWKQLGDETKKIEEAVRKRNN